MSDEKEKSPAGPAEAVPRPRIQALSDLIFGLALSIGAVAMLAQRPSNIEQLLLSLLIFGWAFVILALVWVRYTKVMSVLPVETSVMMAANMLLLFLVSIEPYLYNLLIDFSSSPQAIDTSVTSTLYALDMGSIFVVIAYFMHELTREERKLIPHKLVRSYRLQRDSTIFTALLFYASALPVFWSISLSVIPVRFIFWMLTFVTAAVRKLFEKGASHSPPPAAHQ